MKHANNIRLPFILSFILVLSSPLNYLSASQEKIVIALRGASGYLPEHTLGASVMAYASGVDFLELDL